MPPARKNKRHIAPLAATVKETPIVHAKLPASKFPKGKTPAKVNINALITLPRKASGTLCCRMVFTKLMAITPKAPVPTSAAMESA